MPPEEEFDVYPREVCFQSIALLIEDHMTALQHARSQEYTKTESLARVTHCQLRADLVLRWALRYDVAPGPDVILDYVTLHARNTDGQCKCTSAL